MKKRVLNIAITVTILFAFLFLTNAGLVHHHDDGTVHQECQMCILISFAVTAVITSLILTLYRQELFIKVNPIKNTTFSQNYFKLNYPDRAPPPQA